MMSIYEKLTNLQVELKAPKGQKNTFGNYNYRSAEDILEAVKPLLEKYKLTQIISDEILVVGDGQAEFESIENVNKYGKKEYSTQTKKAGQRYYLKSTVTLINSENSEEKISVTGFARESETKKGMDDSQITGTASSYARKYALNGLYAIDDTKDSDTNEYKMQTMSEKERKIQELVELAEKLGYTNEQMSKMINSTFKKKSSNELTVKEIDELMGYMKSAGNL